MVWEKKGRGGKIKEIGFLEYDFTKIKKGDYTKNRRYIFTN